MSKPSSNLYSSRRHVVLSYFRMSTTCLSRNLIALHGFRWPPQLAYRFLIRCAPAEHNSIVLLRNQRAFHAPTEATALAPAAYACTSIRRLLAQLSKNMHLPGQAKRKKSSDVQTSSSRERWTNPTEEPSSLPGEPFRTTPPQP